MRVQVLSDLHMNFGGVENVDVLMIAGDVAEGAIASFECIRTLVPLRVPVIAVIGNHEYNPRGYPGENEAFDPVLVVEIPT
jgi:predicted phosphodiesterase